MTIPHAMGTVISLWLWTAIHAPDGNLESYDIEDIEVAAGWNGELGLWYKAAVARRLLDIVDGHAQVHDWKDYTSSWTEALRMREYRQSKQNCPVLSRYNTVPSRDNTALSHDGAPDRPDRPTRTRVPTRPDRPERKEQPSASALTEKSGKVQENPEPAKPEKVKYLDFVYLTADEYAKIVAKYGQVGTDERIAELNDGIGSKGYKYKSHYHTILSWDRKHQKEQTNGNRKNPKRGRIEDIDYGRCIDAVSGEIIDG